MAISLPSFNALRLALRSGSCSTTGLIEIHFGKWSYCLSFSAHSGAPGSVHILDEYNLMAIATGKHHKMCGDTQHRTWNSFVPLSSLPWRASNDTPMAIGTLLAQSTHDPGEDVALLLPGPQKQPTLPGVGHPAPDHDRVRVVPAESRIRSTDGLELPLRRERVFLERADVPLRAGKDFAQNRWMYRSLKNAVTIGSRSPSGRGRHQGGVRPREDLKTGGAFTAETGENAIVLFC
ncbi:hypothetical protein BC826DRAFT_442573 [Russula brevipes]|nr:hypothetical protein BC826DRAFT_442573 [Russula brevipes]